MMENQNIYNDLSLAASAEKLLSRDEQFTAEESVSSAETLLADEEAIIATRKHRKSNRYLKLAKSILLYGLALWGLYTLIVQGIQTINRHIEQAQPFQHEHHHDHLTMPKTKPGHNHHHHEMDNTKVAAEHDHHHEMGNPKMAEEHEQHHEMGNTKMADEHQHHALTGLQAPLNSCDCGADIAEALTLGCKYDSLAAAWLPQHCRDDELTAEFETQGPGPNGTWIYWADRDHTQEISVAEIAAMGGDLSRRFHMSYDWHVVHCIYYWIKQYRSLTGANGMIVEPRSDNEGHIRHCGGVIKTRVWGTVAGVVLNTDNE